MSRKRIIQRISAGFPYDMNVNKSWLYHPSYKYFLLGVMIDGTPYKDTWRILSFVYPLFRTASVINVEYCERLSHPDRQSDFFSGKDEVVAADALRAISRAGLLETISAGLTPAAFLRRHDVANLENVRAFRAFDVACATGLCGDVVRARRGLIAARETTIDLATRFKPYRDHDVFLKAVAVGLRSLDDGAEAFRIHMEQEARAAAAAHGFCLPTFG